MTKISLVFSLSPH